MQRISRLGGLLHCPFGWSLRKTRPKTPRRALQRSRQVGTRGARALEPVISSDARLLPGVLLPRRHDEALGTAAFERRGTMRTEVLAAASVRPGPRPRMSFSVFFSPKRAATQERKTPS